MTERLQVWKEGLTATGTRQRRTYQVALLGLELPKCFGEEHRAFVWRWLTNRHHGHSADVNTWLARGDRELVGLREQTNAIVAKAVDKLGRGRAARNGGFLAPQPLWRVRRIVEGLSPLGLGPSEFYRVVAFMVAAYARAEFLVWLNDCSHEEIPFAYRLWGDLHRECNTVRAPAIKAGLVTFAKEGRTGVADSWSFPLLAEPEVALSADEALRVELAEGLVKVLGRRLGQHVTTKRATELRKLARQRKPRAPRWGTGLLTEEWVRRTVRIREERSAPPVSLAGFDHYDFERAVDETPWWETFDRTNPATT